MKLYCEVFYFDAPYSVQCSKFPKISDAKMLAKLRHAVIDGDFTADDVSGFILRKSEIR